MKFWVSCDSVTYILADIYTTENEIRGQHQGEDAVRILTNEINFDGNIT